MNGHELTEGQTDRQTQTDTQTDTQTEAEAEAETYSVGCEQAVGAYKILL